MSLDFPSYPAGVTQYPNGYEEITVNPGTSVRLTYAYLYPGALIYNDSDSAAINYKKTGEDFVGSERGGILNPGDNEFLHTNREGKNIVFKNYSPATITVCVQYFLNRPPTLGAPIPS